MSWHSLISRLVPCTSRKTTLDRKSLPLSPSWSIRKLGDTTDIYTYVRDMLFTRVSNKRLIDFHNSSHQEDVKFMLWLPSTLALSQFCPSIDTKLVDLVSLDEYARKYRSFWCRVPSVMDLVPILCSV